MALPRTFTELLAALRRMAPPPTEITLKAGASAFTLALDQCDGHEPEPGTIVEWVIPTLGSPGKVQTFELRPSAPLVTPAGFDVRHLLREVTRQSETSQALDAERLGSLTRENADYRREILALAKDLATATKRIGELERELATKSAEVLEVETIRADNEQRYRVWAQALDVIKNVGGKVMQNQALAKELAVALGGVTPEFLVIAQRELGAATFTRVIEAARAAEEAG